MRKLVFLFSALPVFFTGCTTLITLSEPETKNKIYSGTVRQADLKCGHGTCFDFPFSLLADTILLPVTIPWTAINLASDEATSGGRGTNKTAPLRKNDLHTDHNTTPPDPSQPTNLMNSEL